MKKLLSFIIVICVLISCSNQSTEPDNNNKKNNQLKIITEGTQIINYGSKSSSVNVTNSAALEALWKGMTSNKNVYSNSSPTSISGKFDANSDYIENGSTRTIFKKCYVYMFEDKAYLSAVYWDNKTGLGQSMRFRLIIINDKGEEHAWYGGGEDINILPDENTDWVKYNSLFGYLKDY